MASLSTVLQIAQGAVDEMGFPSISALVSSSGDTERQVKRIINRIGKDLRRDFKWPRLTKEHTFTLATGVDAYAFPTDFDKFYNRTYWDRTQQWELYGPMSPQEWQWYKSGIVADGPRMRFRVKGIDDEQFFVHPVPDAGVNGNTLVYEYQSTNWLRPKQWETGETITASTATPAYRFNDANYYKATASGATGETAPTHTSGAVSDGGVTWTFTDEVYDEVTQDTDVPNFDAEMMVLGVIAHFKKEKGLEYLPDWQVFQDAVGQETSHLRGSKTLSLSGRNNNFLLSYRNTPDSGYGT